MLQKKCCSGRIDILMISGLFSKYCDDSHKYLFTVEVISKLEKGDGNKQARKRWHTSRTFYPPDLLVQLTENFLSMHFHGAGAIYVCSTGICSRNKQTILTYTYLYYLTYITYTYTYEYLPTVQATTYILSFLAFFSSSVLFRILLAWIILHAGARDRLTTPNSKYGKNSEKILTPVMSMQQKRVYLCVTYMADKARIKATFITTAFRRLKNFIYGLL